MEKDGVKLVEKKVPGEEKICPSFHLRPIYSQLRLA